jgi:hypothetical protein
MVPGRASSMKRLLCGWVAVGLLVAVAASLVVKQRLVEAEKKEQARNDCRTWTSAVESYKMKYGDWPPSLAALTQTQPDGTEPFMRATSLIDPWGHEYLYSPAGGSSHSMRADVWSWGPRPNDVSSIIGNWE